MIPGPKVDPYEFMTGEEAGDAYWNDRTGEGTWADFSVSFTEDGWYDPVFVSDLAHFDQLSESWDATVSLAIWADFIVGAKALAAKGKFREALELLHRVHVLDPAFDVSSALNIIESMLDDEQKALRSFNPRFGIIAFMAGFTEGVQEVVDQIVTDAGQPLGVLVGVTQTPTLLADAGIPVDGGGPQIESSFTFVKDNADGSTTYTTLYPDHTWEAQRIEVTADGDVVVAVGSGTWSGKSPDDPTSRAGASYSVLADADDGAGSDVGTSAAPVPLATAVPVPVPTQTPSPQQGGSSSPREVLIADPTTGEYLVTHNLHVRGDPAELIRQIEENPNKFFPFTVTDVVRSSAAKIEIGRKLALQVAPGSDLLSNIYPNGWRVVVSDTTDTSFTFTVDGPHIDPIGSQIMFSASVGTDGDLRLTQWGVPADSIPWWSPFPFPFETRFVQHEALGTWDDMAKNATRNYVP